MKLEFNEDKFLNTYRGSENFTKDEANNGYYRAFLELLQDEEMLNKIKFANDYFGIAPIKTYLTIRRKNFGGNDPIFNKKMSRIEKQGFGACFGYLYKFMYNEGYEAEQTWLNDDITGIVTASCFKK